MDELPEAQVAATLADVRRRLPRNNAKAWAPEASGSSKVHTFLPIWPRTDDYVAAFGFGRDSL